MRSGSWVRTVLAPMLMSLSSSLASANRDVIPWDKLVPEEFRERVSLMSDADWQLVFERQSVRWTDRPTSAGEDINEITPGDELVGASGTSASTRAGYSFYTQWNFEGRRVEGAGARKTIISSYAFALSFRRERESGVGHAITTLIVPVEMEFRWKERVTTKLLVIRPLLDEALVVETR